MANQWSKTLVFDGKTYTFLSAWDNKATAQQSARIHLANTPVLVKRRGRILYRIVSAKKSKQRTIPKHALTKRAQVEKGKYAIYIYRMKRKK